MIDRDTVDYRDTSSFDDSSLQDIQTIQSAILHKQYGKDVRSALAQLPDALIKLFGDTWGNSNTEVEEARGVSQEQLDSAIQGIRNIAYQIEKGTDDGNSNAENVVARTNINGKTYNSLGSRLDSIERAMQSAGIKLEEYND